MSRDWVSKKKRWIVKIGSALLTNDGQGLNVELINQYAKQIAQLKSDNIEVLLVSSGSIVAGMTQLGMQTRPSKVNDLQAAAAVGQASLVRHYEQALKPFDINIAQVLLTHADVANRERYLNAKGALLRLIELNVLTVINENDSVSTDEICFGDNDSLAALVANLVSADLLVILTDQNGLYTADPRTDSNVELVKQANSDDESLLKMASGGSIVGRGGMITKLIAAQSAGRSGASTIIANGREDSILQRLYAGEELGTHISASGRIASKKQWMADQLRLNGTLSLDTGAIKVLQSEGKSLLPVGVTNVIGDFSRGELIKCVDQDNNEVARGLINYNSQEVNKIMGKNSRHIAEILGYGGEDELIHRDNLVLRK